MEDRIRRGRDVSLEGLVVPVGLPSKRRRRLVKAIPLLAAVALSLTALLATSALAQEKVTFVFASNIPGSAMDATADEIIAELSERTDGRIQGRKVAGDAIGGEREVSEAIQLNTVDMSILSVLGADAVVGRLGFAYLPYMFSSYEDADKYFVNGWLGDEVDKVLLESGMVSLSRHDTGFRQLLNNTRPISTVEDLKGLKVRVPEIPSLLRFYELAGALPVAMAMTEILPALQQGTIDGIDNSVFAFDSLHLFFPNQYLTLTNHMYTPAVTVAGTNFWNSLSTEDQELVREVSVAASKRLSEKNQAIEKQVIDTLAQLPVTVNEVSPELDEGLRMVAAKVLEEATGTYDAALLERIRTEFYQN